MLRAMRGSRRGGGLGCFDRQQIRVAMLKCRKWQYARATRMAIVYPKNWERDGVDVLRSTWPRDRSVDREGATS